MKRHVEQIGLYRRLSTIDIKSDVATLIGLPYVLRSKMPNVLRIRILSKLFIYFQQDF